MSPLPLHPAIVHIPLGLAFVMPLLALGLTWATWRGHLPRRAFAAVVALQLLVGLAGVAALQTGEAEEDRVERVVRESLIEAHEEAAQAFTVAAFMAAALGLLVLLLKSERASRAAAAVTTVATLGVAGLGVQAGKRGGELVYRHGAAQVHAAAAGLPAVSSGAGRHPDGDGDDD